MNPLIHAWIEFNLILDQIDFEIIEKWHLNLPVEIIEKIKNIELYTLYLMAQRTTFSTWIKLGSGKLVKSLTELKFF